MTKEEEKSNEELSNKQFYSIVIMLIIVISVMAFVMFDGSTLSDTRHTTVKGKIINVYPVLNSDGTIKYLTVIFNDGNFYKIKVGSDDVDFTVHSKIILQLKYYVERDHFWNDYKREDNYYYLEQIIKVPD